MMDYMTLALAFGIGAFLGANAGMYVNLEWPGQKKLYALRDTIKGKGRIAGQPR